MDSKLRMVIFTGPMEEDWLVAELYYEDELWGELLEWGEKLVIHPRRDGGNWQFSTEDVIELITRAKERVKFIPE